MDAPPTKKAKDTSSVKILSPLEVISHRELRKELSKSGEFDLFIESGSANSVFKVRNLDLSCEISGNEGTLRSSD